MRFQFTKQLHMFLTMLKKVKISLPLENRVIFTHVLPIQQVAVLEERIAALEGGVGALATASGMAAITYAVLGLAHAGDHVVAATTLYGGTFNLLKETLPRYGVTTTFVDVDNPEEIEAAIKDNTKLVLIESLGNPLIQHS